MQTDATTSNIVAPTMLDVFVSVLAMECKRMQHCCATLRRSRNKRNVGSYWLKSLTGFKLCATTRNNMQQGVQTDEIKHVTSNNVGSCWLLVVGCWLLVVVASVCTQPYIVLYLQIFNTQNYIHFKISAWGLFLKYS